jgi:hypothetical protein
MADRRKKVDDIDGDGLRRICSCSVPNAFRNESNNVSEGCSHELEGHTQYGPFQ